MERKIGEIFELGGEWYQCVKSPDGSCKHCDMNFGGKCPIPIKECVASSRSDLSYVIFKKLEKVGGTYAHNSVIVQKYKIRATPVIMQNEPYMYFNAINNTIEIEIKQTKEDMEENRTINQQFAECEQTINDVVRKCYTENKSTQIKDMEEYKIHDAKEYIPEFDKVVDECLFGKQELKLKPFDLQKAKAGKPVCTRDGRKARIICFDAKGKQPIIALFEREKADEEIIQTYNVDGRYYGFGKEDHRDLMMLPEKKEGWVNVYKKSIYKTKEEAFNRRDKENYLMTIKVDWEE